MEFKRLSPIAANRAKKLCINLFAALDGAVGKKDVSVVQLDKVGVGAVISFLFSGDDGRGPLFRAVRTLRRIRTLRNRSAYVLAGICNRLREHRDFCIIRMKLTGNYKVQQYV